MGGKSGQEKDKEGENNKEGITLTNSICYDKKNKMVTTMMGNHRKSKSSTDNRKNSDVKEQKVNP